MKNPLSAAVCLVGCGILAAAVSRIAHAEDIDIYAGGGVSTDLPNVILVLDSSANWSSSIPVGNCYYKDDGVLTSNGPKATSPNKEQGTKMGIEKCALYNLIDSLPVRSDGSAEFNVGLMLFNESPASNSGGYPRRALVALNSANKTALKSAIAGLGINADKGNNAAFSKALYEAFLYFKAAKPYRGTAGTKWDHAATVGGLAGGNYITNANTGCARNHIIFIANGGPGEVTDSDAKALLAAAGGSTTPIVYPTSYVTNSDQANWADEFARFMFGADVSSQAQAQNIITHAVAVTGASSDGKYPNFIKSIAKHGGGHYVEASDSDSLSLELKNIFIEIQAVSSVFSAASLPISVNASGTYLNRIYMGMFVPDREARPRWNGNLKQYQFSYDQATDSLSLVDRSNKSAISSSSGFISPTASSFWTTDSSFWINQPSGVPLSASDNPDGDVVQKGAVAQGLRTAYATDQSGRKVFTCLSCASGTVLGSDDDTSFATSNSGITSGLLNVGSGTERDALIDWVRGTDNQGDEAGPGGTTTVRPSIHGDALHSRPAAINYGGSTGVVVFYGANDGMLHAVNGEQTGADAGSELWSFVPEEMLGRLNRLRTNSPIIAFPNIPLSVSPTPTRRDYFVDGPVSFYEHFNSSGAADKVYLYVAMRRGGRVLYAFDVTDPTVPKYLWKVTPAEVPELGYTWSEARVAKIRGNANPVLVMGAGYDPAAEDVTPTGTATMGNSVVILDAFTGEPLRAFTGIDRPVPADVSLIDSDFDGYIDRAYAVDLGGTIYRIDFEPAGDSSSSGWQMLRLAELGTSGGKKFFYRPDVVLTKNYATILVGSGDREKPLLAATTDYFYSVIDPTVGKTPPGGFTSTKFADLIGQSDAGMPAGGKGCYIALDTAGEKVVTSALTVGGNTYFSTNMPQPVAANSCSSNLGVATVYSVPLQCKTPTKVVLNGGGLPPSPVAGIVQVAYTNPDGSVVMRQQPFIIGSGAKASPIEVEKVKIPVSPRRTRRYWYYESAQ
jgi:type IV pilus assembly protein PilY1